MKLGKHEVLLEGDLVVCHSNGTLETEEAEAFQRIVRRHFVQHGSMYLLLVVHEVGKPPSSTTRRLIAQWQEERPVTAAAIVSDNVLVRGAVALVAAAVGAFHRKRTPLAFFSSEATAREWLCSRSAKSG